MWRPDSALRFDGSAGAITRIANRTSAINKLCRSNSSAVKDLPD
jgi:hypothetical protein